MRYLAMLFMMLFINSSVLGRDMMRSFHKVGQRLEDAEQFLTKLEDGEQFLTKLEDAEQFLTKYDSKDWNYKTNSWSSYTIRSKSNGSSADQNGFKYSCAMAPIDKIFPKYRIKKIKLNPNGDKVVCLIEDKTTRVVRIFSASSSNSWSQTVNESTPIDNFELFGSNIIYTYTDKSGNICVTAVNSRLEKRKIKIDADAKSVRFIAGTDAVIAEVYLNNNDNDNNKYCLYRVDSRSSELIKKTKYPAIHIFDKDLSTKLINRRENGRMNVFTISKQKSKRKSNRDFWGSSDDDDEENSVSFESDEADEDTKGLNLIKCIDNPNQERPISVDSEGNIWWIRIEHGSGQSAFVVEKVNSDTLSVIKVRSIFGVSSLNQVYVSINSRGYPILATFNGNKYQHFVIDSAKNGNIRGHIDYLNSRLGNWYFVNISSNNRFWLICEPRDNTPERFHVYDTANGSLKRLNEIDSLSSNVAVSHTYQTSCQFVSIPGTKEKLQMFVTQGAFRGGNGLSTDDAPCIILLNSEEQYHKGYTPMVQWLANLGCNVICLNYSDYHVSEFDIERFKSCLVTAVNWCTRNDFAKHGNIILLAKNHSCIHAFDIFAKNKKIFNFFIALSPDENDMNRMANHNLSDQTSKRVVFVLGDHIDNDELQLVQRIGSYCSILSLKNNGVTQFPYAIILSFILKKYLDTVRTYKSLLKEVEKKVDIISNNSNTFGDTDIQKRSDKTKESDNTKYW